MAEPKTRPTDASVADFLSAAATDAERLEDCRALVKLMSRITGAKAVMWGPSIVGFGSFVYRRRSGGDYAWPVAAFSPRKPEIVVYLMNLQQDKKLLASLGKYKAPGVSCLYIKRLADVDMEVLETLIQRSGEKVLAMEKSQVKTEKAAKSVKPAKPKRAAKTARANAARKPARAR